MKASLSGLLLVFGLAVWVPGLRAQNGVVICTVVAAGSFEPVPGASVSVVGTSRQVVTDALGRFRIDGLAGTNVTLEVKRIGFSPASQAIDVGRLPVRIELAQRASVLDAIVVTGICPEWKSTTIPTFRSSALQQQRLLAHRSPMSILDREPLGSIAA